jgi:dolichol-phosphate mannosyltransferase
MGADQTIAISVASPAYNEAETIAAVVQEWVRTLEGSGRSWEIVVTDDGSTDGTGPALAALGDPRVRVIRLESNHGYGGALACSIEAARGRYVVTIDSDGQFDLGDSLPMIARLEAENLDFINGRRMGKKDTAVKVAADRILNLMVRALFPTGLRDTNCALKAMTRDAARRIRIEAMGFPTPTEMVLRAARLGQSIGEAPVQHRARAGGESKLVAWRSAFSFLAYLLYLRGQFFLEDRAVIRKGPA